LTFTYHGCPLISGSPFVGSAELVAHGVDQLMLDKVPAQTKDLVEDHPRGGRVGLELNGQLKSCAPLFSRP
jgi:hypothetical protein